MKPEEVAQRVVDAISYVVLTFHLAFTGVHL